MKYTVCGFSQSEALELKLDGTDLQILRWFIDFFSTGKMVHITESGADGKMTIYSWVKYDAVINDLPCLGIHNTRVIARRFDNLVRAGVLEKKVKKTVKGTYTFFRIVETELDRLLSSSNLIKRQDEKNSASNGELESVLKSTDSNNSGLENDATVLKSDMPTVLEGVVPTVLRSTTKRSFIQSYPSIKYKEKAAAAAPTHINVEEECKRISTKLVFPKDFYEKARCFMRDNDLDVAYICWLYQRNMKKNPRDMRSYFLKTFFAEDIPELYHAQKVKKEALIPHDVTCPVCGSIHYDYLHACPVCKLSNDSIEDRYEIEYRKWFLSLSEDVLKDYQAQWSHLSNESLRTHIKIDDLRKDLAKKFGFQFNIS